MTAKLTPLPMTLLTSTLLTGVLLVSACQPQSTSGDSDSQASEQLDAEDNKKAVQSDSAKARIAQFEPLYVVEMQRLQQRLQTEYEAFEASDITESDNGLLTAPATLDQELATTFPDNKPTSEPTIPLAPDATITTTTPSVAPDTQTNISAEVGERDVAILKSINLEPQKPRLLTQEQTIKRYQQAIKALYQPVSEALSAENIDTLINISTLIPELFEHEEIAKRLNIKSPALARLIVRYQVAQQIEAQQLLEMQQMKETQQQEFEGLMTKFNETIEDYDKQIAKYEETLKEFK